MVYRKDWGQPMQGLQGFARTVKAFGRKCNISLADMNTLGNSVGLFIVPGGFMITGMIGPQVPAFGTSFTLPRSAIPRQPRPLSPVPPAARRRRRCLRWRRADCFSGTFTDTEIQLTVTAARHGGTGGGHSGTSISPGSRSRSALLSIVRHETFLRLRE